ncbi:hypothetical protein [Peptostreptococcus canis]|uniref:Uncharacterized protein n=1 Tax=Peptostreptococcus canis TaxID=1159213 RepID=A0ABR6TL29_9FIRM|nr:hypothetical protein [Peptostreptococcus canis]MBC2576120.1 hypothetical protein [Peptostreptococcus canis]MBP1998347.1 amino acid permease [Peptostreptococcus canis]
MDRKSLIWGIVFFLCSLAWGFVAYRNYTETILKFSYLQVVLSVGFMILAIAKFYMGRKNDR